MTPTPVGRREVNEFISRHHRHHKPVQGFKCALGLADDEGNLIGVATVGRPVSRHLDDGRTAEVTRLCTDGTPNACSYLYGASARIAKEMGYERIQTYVLESEPATSLKASGWVLDGLTKAEGWNRPSRDGRRTDQPTDRKQRWSRRLKPPAL